MKDDGQVTEQAAYWLEQMNRPVIDAAIAERFDRWMEADPDHRQTYSRLQGLWDSPTMTAALSRSEAAAASDATRLSGNSRWRSLGLPIGLAAACAAVVLASLPSFSTQTYRTPTGPGGHFELADGSRIDLSGNAELTVRMLPWSRSAVLARGEVFMDVEPERFRRFTVESGPAQIRVLGTAFNIDRQDERDTVVQVYRGIVAVDGLSGARQILRKGQAVKVTHGDIRAVALPAGERPDWLSGWFEMSNAPLSVLVDKLNRYTERPVRIGDNSLAQRKISGRFHISEPPAVLQALKVAYGIEAIKGNDAITLR